MGAPGPLQGRGFSHSWGCRGRAFTGLCHTGGRYSGLWVVLFVSPYLWVRGRCRGIIRRVMCRLLLGRWRRSSLAVIWLRRLVVLTARPSVLSSEAVGADRPVTDLDPGLVAAVFAERWDGCATATWNTRAGRDPGVRFVVWGAVASGRRSAGGGGSTSAADG